MVSGSITPWQIDGNNGDFIFHGFIFQRLFFMAPKLLKMVTAAMKFKNAYSLEEKQ